MMRFLSLALLLVGIGFTLALCQPDVEGCAAVPRRGDTISIAEESAVIVWDPVKKVEHFIRRAAFDTKSPDFGFLVPTPTQPTLAEVKDRVFGDMDRWILPRTVEQNRLSFYPMLCCFGGGTKSATMSVGAKGGVRILAEQQVGGFNTTVLEADDTGSLGKWITDHGYSSDPELESWLAPYVAAKWKITAFKIVQDPKTGQLATTKPVRMSFATDRPFFPYREPEKKDADLGDVKEKNTHVPTEIDGIWKVESADGEGDNILQGTKFWFVAGVAVGRYLKDTKYTVDASKEPKWLDLGNKLGIYKLDGDTLHWCRGTVARPGSFDSKEGSLLVLRRDRKAEADDAAASVKAKESARLHGGTRLLRVYFVADTRMDGKLGNAAWHAKVPWSDQLDDEQRKEIAKQTGVAEADIPANAWMTTFEDRASPRPGKDEVYFDPAQDRTPIRPPPFIKYNQIWIPADLVLVGLLFAYLMGLVLKRAAAAGGRRLAPPPPFKGPLMPPWSAS